MGSADFAVPSLRALAGAGYEIGLVVTRPDKPKGRGLEMSRTPVKLAATDLGIEVFQPPGLKKPENQKIIRDVRPDAIVVAAYGRILPTEVLAIPPRLPHGQYGCVNVHGSLLPKYRGAAPIQWAVMNGEEESGVTIMAMDEGMDTGDVMASVATPIGPRDTAGTLFDRLAVMGADLLVRTLSGALDGSCEPKAQDETAATYAPIISKSDGKVDWATGARKVTDLVRGTDPWPGAFTHAPSGLRIRLFPPVEDAPGSRGEPGEILAIDEEGMTVMTGSGAVLVSEVQPAGKRRMTPRELANGRKIAVGEVFGDGP